MSSLNRILSVFLGLGFLMHFAVGAETRVWEESIVLPTYEVGAPDHNPRFYSGRAYQGAQGRVYPYPMIDSLSDNRISKSYKAVYLENEFIKVCVVPEIGGRILSAVDKTNGHDFFYRQTVIKPALIGMIGAWISGGVEWNFPHHHRPTVFMSVDYTYESHPDGSSTVWVGEMEIRHRMRWTIGLTIYPGKSYIEATLKPMNRTPFPQTFLFFANAGIHSNEDYQVFFPPSTEYATYHGKNQFSHWPMAREVFNGIDYSEGVDASWWKNHPEWTSMFAWNYRDDFFGGYDHGKKAGTVSVANHHVAPGKKFWEWSAGPRGELWDHILTEKDGPELELMTGAYSDNQPDYSWLQPLESKIVRFYWYPIRELGGLKFANLKGALNLEKTGSRASTIAVNTTGRHKAAEVTLSAGDEVLFQKQIDIDPSSPFKTDVELPAETDETSLRLVLRDSSGGELLSYQPQPPPGEPMPEPVEPPAAPAEIKSVEELCLAGLRLEQFFNPALDPEPYYREALRRDPGNYRVNVALGIRHLKTGMFETAREEFAKAVTRATRNYTSPRDGEALYYQGLTLRFLGQEDEAYKVLYKATWSYAFHSASYLQLAEISSSRGDYESALDQIDRALATNSWSARARVLKAAILRNLGRDPEALSISDEVLTADPLNFWAGWERYLTLQTLKPAEASEHLGRLRELMRDEVQSYLELSVNYAWAGLYDEAIEVLSGMPGLEKSSGSAMAYYYLGHYWFRKGDAGKGTEFYSKAASRDPRYVFPFRLESIDILRHALEVNPEDAKAPYYLGNLFFDHQPGAAIQWWEKSRSLDDRFMTVHRNLAFGYSQHEGDIPKAIQSLEKAVELDPADARLLYELDLLYERSGKEPAERRAFLESRKEVLEKRDDSMSRLVLAYVLTERYDEAIEILENRHFHVWEGSRGLRDAYVDAYLLRGLSSFRSDRFESALSDYQKALEFPLNLENAWPYRGGRIAEIHYLIGTALEALGRRDQALESYGATVSAKQQQEWSDLRYYEAMALRKIGQEDEALALLQGLMSFASSEGGSGVGFFSKFGEREPLNVRRSRNHYLRGLVYLSRDETAVAGDEFDRAVTLNKNNVWARAQLSQIEGE